MHPPDFPEAHPDVFENLNDASVGAWLIDILSDIGDNLNYHIDRNVQETYLDSSKEFTSIQTQSVSYTELEAGFAHGTYPCDEYGDKYN